MRAFSTSITAHLGSGGMGDVYEATDTKLGRSVAIKFVPEAFSHDTERVARFQREARVLASLNHPNIAAIHGLEDGFTFQSTADLKLYGHAMAMNSFIATVTR